LRFCAGPGRLIFANVVVLFLLLVVSTSLFGQNTVGASVAVTSGLDDNPRLSFPLLGLGPQAERAVFYGVFPAISLESKRARSVFNASYAFGWNRFNTDLPIESKSHSAGIGFSTPVGARWNVDLGESYSRSNDLQTFYALRGLAVVEEELVYVFAPVGANVTYYTNRANVSVTRTFSERSTLALSAEHTLRGYGGSDLSSDLVDQQSTSGGVGYSRRLNERVTWNLEHRATFHSFDGFNSALTNVVRTGLTAVLKRGTTFAFTVGPSFVTNPGTSGRYTSYEATASLQQDIKDNSFHFAFSQDSGSVTGLGSVSKTRRATAGFGRTLGSRVSVFADATGFDSTGILDNTFNTKGLFASANMGFALTTKLAVQGGVSYQRYNQPSDFKTSQKRVFASLHYSVPNLLRWR